MGICEICGRIAQGFTVDDRGIRRMMCSSYHPENSPAPATPKETP